MKKHLMMWTFLCSTAPLMCAQNLLSDTLTTDSDSTFYLNEVVVKASPIINKIDGKAIRPNEEMVNSATGGIDLLRKLQLSRLIVNPLTNSVEISGGGEVRLCINGVEATSTQVAALDPKEIVKIEYHDTPGIRFSGADIVIDYITRRNDSGGNLFVDSFDAIGNGKWASIDNIAAQYNKGRSVWMINAAYFGKRGTDWIRNYDEKWNYPDFSIERHEYGLPVTVGNHSLETNINYNYLLPSGNMFNVRLGFNLDDVPNKEQGDRRATLITSDSEIPILVEEHTEEKTLTPNLGLYYQHMLGEGKSFILDGQTSYMKSKVIHDYREDGEGETNRVDGDKYSFKVLGMYEALSGSQRWSAGISNNTSFIRNNYRGIPDIRADINQSETEIMGEYSNRFGNWGLMANLKGVYRHLSADLVALDKFFILPEVNLSFRPVDKWFIRYSASMDYKMPSAAEITDVEQPIQMGMVRRGNPDLKPFRVIAQSFEFTFQNDLLAVTPRIEYRNEHKPIMESVIFENGEFVRTYFNQRSFQRLVTGGSVAVRPWKDHLSIMVEPLLTRYFSHGLDYSHCHNIFRVGVAVDFSYAHWLFYGNLMSGPDNYMYGEEIIEEKDMNQLMVGYKRDKWSISAGVFNAFGSYWMESRNLSALTPYSSKATHGKGSTYFALKFNLLLDFGKKCRDVDMRQSELDNDSGIISGNK